jgi:hypothetical protein
MLLQIPEPQTADMTTEHFRAIQPPDQLGRRVEMADVKIAIDDHHGIVRPLQRCQQELRGLYSRKIVSEHHPTLVPAGMPSRPYPDAGTPFWRKAYGSSVLKWFFGPVPSGGTISSLRIR